MKYRCAILPLLLFVAQSIQADLAKGLEAAASRHWTDALREFRPLAEQGDANAQVNLGNLYMRGLAVKQDYLTAFDWYAKAARQGNVAGQAKLGLMYYYGLGIQEDRAEAMRWFLKAGEQGDPEAAMVLGTLYDQGSAGRRQPAEAYLWYSIAADLGKEDAEALRTKLLDDLSPADLNTALTRLNVWRDQHDSVHPDWSSPESATLITRLPPDRKPAQASRKATAGKPSKKKTGARDSKAASKATHSPK